MCPHSDDPSEGRRGPGAGMLARRSVNKKVNKKVNKSLNVSFCLLFTSGSRAPLSSRARSFFPFPALYTPDTPLPSFLRRVVVDSRLTFVFSSSSESPRTNNNIKIRTTLAVFSEISRAIPHVQPQCLTFLARPRPPK